jgi:hydroxymethylglutaryl-CoA reductase
MTKAIHTKFYELTIPGRREMLQKWSDLDDETLDALCGIPGLTSVQADGMIENVVGLYNLPLGIARNFIVNGREVLVPMVIEEPSVVAGASYMAKLVAANGGFTATSSESIMIGQMQVLDLTDLDHAELAILQNRADLLQEASIIDPILQSIGGGLRDIVVRQFKDSPIGAFLVIHFLVDVRDAMGANAVNTIVECLACICASSPTWPTSAWRKRPVKYPWLTWLSMISPARTCGTASWPPGHLLQWIPTAQPPITRAS